jgi:hypothetical protein
VTKLLVHVEESKNAILHSTSQQILLKECVLNYDRQLAPPYDRETRHQHSNTTITGPTAHTGDMAEGTTVDTANVADPVAIEVAINAIKREKIFVRDTVESMENHAKRNAMSVDKWDVGQLNTP